MTRAVSHVVSSTNEKLEEKREGFAAKEKYTVSEHLFIMAT